MSEELNEAFRLARDRDFHTKTDEQLHSLAAFVMRVRQSQLLANSDVVIECIENEIARRRTDRLLEETQKLQGITTDLTAQTVKLVGVAEAQRVLAVKLDGQTDTLIKLTGKLNGLTVWLVVLTVVLCVFEVIHFFVR